MSEPGTIELVPTELLKDGWMQQDQVYPDQWWVKKYWGDTEGSHRDAIIRALEGVGDFASVLEVGCNTGPNLRRIHRRWPQVDLMGMDIHPAALKYGQEQARQEGWHWAGYPGDLRDLHALGKNVADVVLSCYALAYLDPRDIDQVLEACIKAARRAVVLCEPMVLAGDEQYLPPGKGAVPEYQYCYPKRLEMWPLKVEEIQPPHARLQYVLTLLK